MKIYKYLTAAAVAAMMTTSCYEGELYDEGPDWVADKIAEEAAKKAANQGGEGEEGIEGLLEDVYTVGATDYSSGWWAQFSKYYVIPEGQQWITQFDLHINPDAPNTYKNYALILTNDVDRGGDGYKEYGAIRYDFQPSGNSEWGDYIDRSLATSNLEFATDTDEGVGQLGGKVTLTIDRSSGGLIVTMTNGTITKTYTQKTAIENLNADASNTNIRAFLVPEGSYIDFIGTTIEPIGGCTSKEDKQPLSLTLNGVPSEVLAGTSLSEAMANVTAVVQFEQGVSKNVTAADLQIEAIPNMDETGQKTLIVIYNKTFKGETSAKAVIANKSFKVVNELSAFTQSVVFPSTSVLGAEDNSSPFWGAHTENFKVGFKETKVITFTNYTSKAANWNNFLVVLCKEDNTEYAVLRADNFGWGNGYAACQPSCGQGNDEEWAAWLNAMDGAKVTVYVTNNGDGTADVRCVMIGNDNKTYTQVYKGINTIDPDNFYFRLSLEGSHLVFDKVVGADDNSTAFWGAHSPNIQVISHQVCTINFTNHTSKAANWNNFLVVLCKEDNAEYAVLRADNFGWGDGYAACKKSCGQTNDEEWAAWLNAMDGAKVKLQVSNNGDGTADINATITGSDGKEYHQEYIGVNMIDADNFYFRLTVEGAHVVFE